MLKLLLLAAAVLATSHCLTMQHTTGYNTYYNNNPLFVEIDGNTLSFVGCNKNIGTIQQDAGRKGAFKVTGWRTLTNNTCKVDNDQQIESQFSWVTQKRDGWSLILLDDEAVILFVLHKQS